MSDGTTHFVVTRYNVGMYSRPDTANQLGLDPDDWMEERFRIFSAVTLPSLKAQSCQNFEWLLFTDPRTPSRFAGQLAEVAADWPALHISPADRSLLGLLKSRIADRAAEIVLTSRIDNDDAWHVDYVRSMQSGGYPTGTVVDYQDSYWLDIETPALYHCRTRWWTGTGWWRRWRTFLVPKISNSPTLIERADGAQTVLAREHRDLHRLYGWRHVVMIRNRPRRLVTCHRRNLLNRIGSGEGRFTPAPLEVLDEFGVSLSSYR